MAKKMLISLAMVFLFLCCSVCFAAENNSNMSLGNSMTEAMDKTGEKIKNGTDDMMNSTENVMNAGYNAVRTSVDDTAATATTMSTTTWIWIILAVAAIVIVAMIWYYAIQDNTRD